MSVSANRTTPSLALVWSLWLLGVLALDIQDLKVKSGGLAASGTSRRRTRTNVAIALAVAAAAAAAVAVAVDVGSSMQLQHNSVGVVGADGEPALLRRRLGHNRKPPFAWRRVGGGAVSAVVSSGVAEARGVGAMDSATCHVLLV